MAASPGKEGCARSPLADRALNVYAARSSGLRSQGVVVFNSPLRRSSRCSTMRVRYPLKRPDVGPIDLHVGDAS
jgi:hypothetical protein